MTCSSQTYGVRRISRVNRPVALTMRSRALFVNPGIKLPQAGYFYCLWYQKPYRLSLTPHLNTDPIDAWTSEPDNKPERVLHYHLCSDHIAE